jgi:hypothetical protein
MHAADLTRRQSLEYDGLFVLEHFLGYPRFERLFGKRRRRLYERIDRSLTGLGRGQTLPVPELAADAPAAELRRERGRAIVPKVFRGAAADWNCTTTWNLDFLADEHGHHEVILNDNVGLVDRGASQEFETLTLRDYIRAVRSGSRKYLKFSRFVDEERSLREDLRLAWLRRLRMPDSFREETYTFIGGAGTVTPVHCGFSCNVFVQVHGRKKWIIYAPAERAFLDLRTTRTFYFHSDCDPYDLDDPKFPLLKYARKYEIILEPGDVLWVPPFAWHQVENQTESIGIAYRYNSILAALRSSVMLTALFFMATRPNVFLHFLVTMWKRRAYIFIKRQEDLSPTAPRP